MTDCHNSYAELKIGAKLHDNIRVERCASLKIKIKTILAEH